MILTKQILVGELLCEAVDVHPGEAVLDVATGSGNTALAAARRGGEVTGIDFVSALLARGRERAAAERLTITFQEGDAETMAWTVLLRQKFLGRVPTPRARPVSCGPAGS